MGVRDSIPQLFGMPTGPVPDAAAAASSRIVKSVQAVSVTIAASATSGTASINPVDPSKSLEIMSGFLDADNSGTGDKRCARLELTSSGLVTAYRNTAGTNAVVVTGYIVEFAQKAVTNVIRGTVLIGSGLNNADQAISSVDTSRAVAAYTGITTTETGGATFNLGAVELTSATNVRAYRQNGGTGTTYTVGFTVVEFAASVAQSVEATSVTISGTNTRGVDDLSTYVETPCLVVTQGICPDSGGGNAKSCFAYMHFEGDRASAERVGTNSITGTVGRLGIVGFKAGGVKSMTAGKVLVADAATSGTASIPPVDPARSIVLNMGSAGAVGTPVTAAYAAGLSLVDADTVQALLGSAPVATSTVEHHFLVIEFA